MVLSEISHKVLDGKCSRDIHLPLRMTYSNFCDTSFHLATSLVQNFDWSNTFMVYDHIPAKLMTLPLVIKRVLSYFNFHLYLIFQQPV